MLKTTAPHYVLLEAHGGYELKLVEPLSAEGLPVLVLNARPVREFARVTGRLAKDRRDRRRDFGALRRSN